MAVVQSEKAIKAQQALSDKFGIVTFNPKGGIQTVPTSGKINSKINVGLGGFKTSTALNQAVQNKIKASSAPKVSNSFGKKSPKITNTVNPPPVSTKTITVPKVLSKRAIEAQQALSDKFGIPTFDLRGGISTVPVSGVFKDINVGFGGFKDEDSFIDAVVSKYSPPVEPPVSGGIVNDISNFFNDLFRTQPEDTTTGQVIQSEPTGLPDESSKTVITDPEELFFGSGGASGDQSNGLTGEEEKEGFIDSILKDKVKLGLAIVAIIGVVLASGGKKK
ncbi:MAG TPA: hypothetical protein VLE02_02730 [Nitrosarchaeum sp.]|nr:hypothetical protein [Nitrosarchaeum sp.]